MFEEVIKYLGEHLRIELDTEYGVIIVNLYIGDQLISSDKTSLPFSD